MKMRKLFAGIAAAATLLGGMALGAVSAQADGAAGTPVMGEATFTFTAETAEQLTNAHLKAYKIGDYVQYGSGKKVAYGVVTNFANENAVDSALKTAGVNTARNQDNLAAALNTGALDISATRPWNTNADGQASTTRAFANALESENSLAGGQQVTFTAPTGPDERGYYSAAVSLQAGIYVFIDSAVATGSVTKAIPMIVASGTVKDKVLTDPVNGANTVNMKNTKNSEKTKTVDKASAAIGDTLTYTLTGTIANPAPAEFKFTDRPGTGLTIKVDTFKFYADNVAISAKEAATDFTVPDSDVTGGENAFFDVIVNNPSKYAGKTIKVTFKAVVNDDASVTDGVVNKLDNYGGTEVEAKTEFVGFDFKKVDPDSKGIENVTFQVKDGGTVLYFVKQAGSYKKAASAATRGATDNVKTDANGELTFTGLAATKTYTVTETERASDVYLDIMPSFTVSFEKGVAVLSRNDASDPWGLVDTSHKTVKNVKSITQLPLTGAAGTTLFTIVALLVAGAGVTVAVKSRQRTH